jgi:membrane protein DedA with SNARE-associated domain
MATLPALAIYIVVGLVIGLESMGVPLPGEITLVVAALMSTPRVALTNPWFVGLAASVGAVAGDSIGYAVGRRGGRALLERVSHRFPRHFGPPHLARAEQLFGRYGVWAVFFGRFIALLRVLAGPLAGALRVPYRRFLLANAAGGVVWAYGTTFAIYFSGQAAEHWLKQSSWIALVVAIVAGLVTTMVLKRRLAGGRLHPGPEEKVEVDTGVR